MLVAETDPVTTGELTTADAESETTDATTLTSTTDSESDSDSVDPSELYCRQPLSTVLELNLDAFDAADCYQPQHTYIRKSGATIEECNADCSVCGDPDPNDGLNIRFIVLNEPALLADIPDGDCLHAGYRNTNLQTGCRITDLMIWREGELPPAPPHLIYKTDLNVNSVLEPALLEPDLGETVVVTAPAFYNCPCDGIDEASACCNNLAQRLGLEFVGASGAIEVAPGDTVALPLAGETYDLTVFDAQRVFGNCPAAFPNVFYKLKRR